ncbi:hypothetical protein DBX26_20010 [Vibrio sp. dhg]|nr:hypothetical protein DBX26_20010 [Vibrio sp. dhg]
MMRRVTGEEQLFDEGRFAGSSLTNKSDVADVIDRHKASLLTCGNHSFQINLLLGHELHWSRAGLPPIRLPCHFPDDFMHTTALLREAD